MKIVVKAAGSLEPPGTLTSPFLTTVYGGVAFTPSGHTANYIVNCVRCQIIVATEMKKDREVFSQWGQKLSLQCTIENEHSDHTKVARGESLICSPLYSYDGVETTYKWRVVWNGHSWSILGMCSQL